MDLNDNNKVTQTINHIKTRLGMDSILREENRQWRTLDVYNEL